MKAFFIVLGGIAYLVLSPVWQGLVLSIIWGWFIVKAFHAPYLSIPLAIGISLVVSMLTYQVPSQEPDEKHTSRSITIGIVYPLMILVMAAIVHLFV